MALLQAENTSLQQQLLAQASKSPPKASAHRQDADNDTDDDSGRMSLIVSLSTQIGELSEVGQLFMLC